ncbi:rhodanese-like domain-containing protein [Kaarinaea lacus]
MQQIIEFSTANPVLVTIFLVLLFLFLRTFVATGGAKGINNMEAVRMMNNDNAFVLDVRTQEEFTQGHINTAVNIPLGLVDTRISDIHNKKSSPVILVCQSGNRSGQAARILKKHGFENLFNLSGGMAGWQQANLPVNSGTKAGSGKDKGASKKSGKKKQRNISSSKSGPNDNVEEPIDSEKEKIIVYSSGHCPFTAKVNKLLEEKGLEFQQVNLSGDPDMRNLIADKAGQSTFPQVFLGDTHIGNCDELYQLEEDGKLNGILGLKHPQGVF